MNTNATSRSSGQILPLFVIALVPLLALAGLGLDGARVFLERRDAQGAADLAALAGARSLPDNAVQAKADAKAIAALNGYTIGDKDVITPYKGNEGKIKVIIETKTVMFLARVVGVMDIDVSASAVAVREAAKVGAASPPLTGPAILAFGDTCGQNDTLKWDAHNATVKGDVITNSGGDINGSNNIMLGNETWLTNVDCESELFIDPAQNPQPEFKPVTTIQPYPFDHTAPPFSNLFSGGLCDQAAMAAKEITVHLMDTDEPPYESGTKIADGVYCRVDNRTTPTLIMSKINIKTAGSECDHCTFVSLLIKASAASIDMNPAIAVSVNPDTGAQSVCAITDTDCGGYPLFTYAPPGAPKDGIDFSGASQLWNGVMFSPTGTTHYSGHDAAIYQGAIWSRIVQIIGSGFELVGPGDWDFGAGSTSTTPEVLALVE